MPKNSFAIKFTAPKLIVPKIAQAAQTQTSAESISIRTDSAPVRRATQSKIHFAMGCFWHAEAVMGAVEGVNETCVGFIQAVEVVRVQFDASRVSLSHLLEVWKGGHEVGKVWANKKYVTLTVFRSKPFWLRGRCTGLHRLSFPGAPSTTRWLLRSASRQSVRYRRVPMDSLLQRLNRISCITCAKSVPV